MFGNFFKKISVFYIMHVNVCIEVKRSIVCFCVEVLMMCSVCFVYVDNFWYNVDHVLLLANALF